MPGWQPTHYSRAQLEERRMAALEWIERGTHRNEEIAEHFGVSVHTVYTWKARLRRNGGLKATVAGGAVSRLTAAQHEQLRTLLREGAVHHGFPDPTWTTRRVTDPSSATSQTWMRHAMREPRTSSLSAS